MALRNCLYRYFKTSDLKTTHNSEPYTSMHPLIGFIQVHVDEAHPKVHCDLDALG